MHENAFRSRAALFIPNNEMIFFYHFKHSFSFNFLFVNRGNFIYYELIIAIR